MKRLILSIILISSFVLSSCQNHGYSIQNTILKNSPQESLTPTPIDTLTPIPSIQLSPTNNGTEDQSVEKVLNYLLLNVPEIDQYKTEMLKLNTNFKLMIRTEFTPDPNGSDQYKKSYYSFYVGEDQVTHTVKWNSFLVSKSMEQILVESNLTGNYVALNSWRVGIRKPQPKSDIKGLTIDISEEDNKQADSISALLSSRKNVYGIEWSLDKKYVVFNFGFAEEENAKPYLWEVGKGSPDLIIGESLVNSDRNQYIFSPDNQYLLASFSTDPIHSQILISIKDRHEIKSWGSLHDSIFSPNSKTIAYTSETNKTSPYNESNYGLFDVVLLDLETMKTRVLLASSESTQYFVGNWESNEQLKVSKNNLKNAMNEDILVDMNGVIIQ